MEVYFQHISVNVPGIKIKPLGKIPSFKVDMAAGTVLHNDA